MSAVGFEIIFILLLPVANGVFAMSEMALVSARKARLQQRAVAGALAGGARPARPRRCRHAGYRKEEEQ